MADSYRQGNMQLEKQLWRRVLNKLYKGEEERLQIEVRIIEAIKQSNCRLGPENIENEDDLMRNKTGRFRSPPQNTMIRKRSRSNSSSGRNNLIPLRSKDVNRPEMQNI